MSLIICTCCTGSWDFEVENRKVVMDWNGLMCRGLLAQHPGETAAISFLQVMRITAAHVPSKNMEPAMGTLADHQLFKRSPSEVRFHQSRIAM